MDICAPFAGIARFRVADGEDVAPGDVLVIVEAVKLEAPVLAPGPGTVRRTVTGDFVDVEGGDVLLQVVPR
ncbi:acetyl-CoA carboxylase biotin carboxyl carrier protein subunit [Corynebacterium bovis]|uniref:biotin/lipoyl-containing protein n=1 Tax=Corynebacterium bovis TaxID=36808 RepID=UPI00244A7425|nr:biotin/lipoyl-containing protein [Corynebacterium bovis]MDH2455211.1 acetyl-CoA carboxylase biotin carboxyl carrier protein subunit [Corynebacterium bovis]